MTGKKIFFLALFCLMLGRAASSEPAVVSPAGDSFSYVIGPGDVLEIQVWRHADLSNKVTVRPDGTFSFPFVEQVSAMDRTIPQVTAVLTEGLSRVINQPVVTINVLTFQSQKIFVLGEVNRPGVYPFEGRVNVIEALSKAAGYKADTSALNSVMIIRKGQGSERQGLRVNVADVIHKGDFSQNVYLNPGDIVFVPKTFIANITTFIQEFFTKTDPVIQYYLDVYNATNPGVLAR